MKILDSKIYNFLIIKYSIFVLGVISLVSLVLIGWKGVAIFVGFVGLFLLIILPFFKKFLFLLFVAVVFSNFKFSFPSFNLYLVEVFTWVIYLLVIFKYFRKISREKTFRLPEIVILIIILWCLGIISGFFHNNPFQAIFEDARGLSFIPLIGMVPFCIKTRLQYKKFINFLFIISIFLILKMIIFQEYKGGIRETIQTGVEWYGSLILFQVLIILLAFLNIIKKSEKKLFYYLIFFGLIGTHACFFKVGLSFWVLIFIGIIWFLYKQYSSKISLNKIIKITTVIGIILFVLIVSFSILKKYNLSPSFFYETRPIANLLKTGTLDISDTAIWTFYDRINMWSGGIKKANKSPIIGNGFGTKIAFFLPHRNIERDSVRIDNEFLWIYVKLGIFGLIIFVYLYWKYFSLSLRLIRHFKKDKFIYWNALAMSGFLLLFMIWGLTMAQVTANFGRAIIFWTILGSIITLKNISLTRKNENIN